MWSAHNLIKDRGGSQAKGLDSGRGPRPLLGTVANLEQAVSPEVEKWRCSEPREGGAGEMAHLA